jgi:general secretion pathway protein B
MSFILDALKKSETDRQRQSGPALYEVKIAPPKSRFPLWAIAVAVLLGANMIIVGWLLLRRTSTHSQTFIAAPATSSSPASVVRSTLPPPAPTPIPAAAPAPALPSAQIPASAPTSTPPPLPVSAPSAASEPYASSSSTPAQAPVSEPPLADNGRQAATPNSEPASGGASPDDYAPAADPGAQPVFKGHVRRGTESGLMLYQDVAATPGSDLPQLRLDLHVYAVKPQDRFALINMRRVREGDSLQGVLVESITQDGVIMSHNGSKFLLPRE